MTSDIEDRLKKIRAKKEASDERSRQTRSQHEEKAEQDRISAEQADKAWSQSSHDLRNAMELTNSELAAVGLNLRADFKLDHAPAIARFDIRLQVNKQEARERLMVNVSRLGLVQIMSRGLDPARRTKEENVKNAGATFWQEVFADFLERAEY